MNTFIVMAEVISEPELRSTPDNKNEISSFLVQFPGKNAEDVPSRLRVTGWNNLAKDIMEKKYQKGDRLIIEGRLRINVVDRSGYKEKITELTAQRVYPIDRPSSPSMATKLSPMVAIANEDDIPF